ncbi:MAG: 4Fe-4S binding protein [Lachnospiraceae bacterium]|nr:4Fe-4S binding protein [Lachnospiraceae bacterium]
MSIRILFDESLCTACGACAIACMDQNDIDTEGGQRPYRRVTKTEIGRIRCISSACMHCEEPACASACAAGCIYRDEKSGLVLYDNSDCAGCHACEAACPYDAVSFRMDVFGCEKMEKCDGCYARVFSGMKPSCVQNCPTGALKVRT